jgi:methyl-accepting chemotaxis protein
VSGAWDQINDMSQRIASQAEEVERASSQVSSTGEEGARASQEAVGEMDQVRIAVVAVAERMRNLRRASEKVSETARAIDQVSTQINLLALNAAIEAAGAGEFGERFGVVAVEVKRLADQTVVATRMIKDLLGEIQLEVAEGIQLTEQGALSVEKGFARVQQLEQVLTGLNGAIEIADRNAKSILGSTKVQVFAVRNARKEVEGIERTLVFQGGPEEVLSGTVAELQRMANDLDEVDPDTI